MKTTTLISLSLIVLSTALRSNAAEPAATTNTAKPAPPESFQIRNQKFGNLLRPEDANSATGTRLVLYPAQPWKCMTWKLHPAGESVFSLQNHFTSKTLEAKGGDAQPAVIQVPFAKEAGERPTWRFKKLPDGLYEITDAKTGKALTAAAGESGAVRVVIADWQEKPEQKWELIKTDPAKLTM
jgi:hypothetical protein